MATTANPFDDDIDLYKNSRKMMAAMLMRKLSQQNPSLGGNVLNALALGIMGYSEKQAEERGAKGLGDVRKALEDAGVTTPSTTTPSTTTPPTKAESAPTSEPGPRTETPSVMAGKYPAAETGTSRPSTSKMTMPDLTPPVLPTEREPPAQPTMMAGDAGMPRPAGMGDMVAPSLDRTLAFDPNQMKSQAMAAALLGAPPQNTFAERFAGEQPPGPPRREPMMGTAEAGGFYDATGAANAPPDMMAGVRARAATMGPAFSPPPMLSGPPLGPPPQATEMDRGSVYPPPPGGNWGRPGDDWGPPNNYRGSGAPLPPAPSSAPPAMSPEGQRPPELGPQSSVSPPSAFKGDAPPNVLAQAQQVALQGGPAAVSKFMTDAGYPKSGAWCGQFAASVASSAGVQPPAGAAVASNWRNIGTPADTPQIGDVAVARPGFAPRRGSGETGQVGSHVTFVNSADPSGTFQGLGGNQGSTVSPFNTRDFEFRRLPGDVQGHRIVGIPGEAPPRPPADMAAASPVSLAPPGQPPAAPAQPAPYQVAQAGGGPPPGPPQAAPQRPGQSVLDQLRRLADTHPDPEVRNRANSIIIQQRLQELQPPEVTWQERGGDKVPFSVDRRTGQIRQVPIAGEEKPKMAAPGQVGVPEPPPGVDPKKWREAMSTEMAKRAMGETIPVEAAGRLAMMQTTQKEFQSSRKELEGGWDATKRAQYMAYRAGQGWAAGDTGRALRNVDVAIESALRAMTGAAAPPAELASYRDKFMPTPFDDEKSRKQKLDLLEDFMSNASKNIMQGRGMQAPDLGVRQSPAEAAKAVTGGWSIRRVQ